MKKLIILSIIYAVTLSTFSQNVFKQKNNLTINNSKMEKGIYAKINTTKGDILIKLEYEKVPKILFNIFPFLSNGIINISFEHLFESSG